MFLIYVLALQLIGQPEDQTEVTRRIWAEMERQKAAIAEQKVSERVEKAKLAAQCQSVAAGLGETFWRLGQSQVLDWKLTKKAKKQVKEWETACGVKRK